MPRTIIETKYYFRERIFLFRDRTVVKTERSNVLAVQIEENGKSLKEKAQAKSFYTEDEAFSAARIHFFCL